MAFSTTDSEVIYEGDGVQTTFEIPFVYLKRSYIKVELYDERPQLADPDEEPITTPLVYLEDYIFDDNETIQLVTREVDGEDITYVPLAVEEGVKVRVYRDTNDVHEAIYSTYNFPYKTVNGDFDQVYQRLQELRREVDRAIKLHYANQNDLSAEDIQKAIEALERLESLVEDGKLGVPIGSGEIGDFLQKSADETTEWVSGSYVGYSTRFNEFIESESLDDMIRKIVKFQYVAPTVTLSVSPSTAVREKGVEIEEVTLTANVTKTAEPLDRVEFYQGATLLGSEPVGPDSGSATFTYTTTFSDNISFRARGYDVTGGNAYSSQITYNFVYPYFFGTGAQGLNASGISSLTKDVRASTASLVKDYTIGATEVFYLAHPSSYADYTLIKDANGFDVTASWTKRNVSVTALDGSTQNYRVYEFNNPQAAGTAQFTFSR